MPAPRTSFSKTLPSIDISSKSGWVSGKKIVTETKEVLYLRWNEGHLSLFRNATDSIVKLMVYFTSGVSL